jgi:3'-5' exoribonuclease
MPPTKTISTLSAMSAGQEADLFLLMTAKEELKTKTGKPYFRVGFRDGTRELSFPIWSDSPWAVDCRDQWNPGTFYKVRAVYQETNFGPQLEIRKIRETVEDDAADGFNPKICMPRSRFDSERMFHELVELAKDHILEHPLHTLVKSLLTANREELLTCPAARHNHHAYIGGLLEHMLSVAHSCIYLADKYNQYYPDMNPPLDTDLVVAGGILHDIGKIEEMDQRPEGTVHTPEGAMIGHILIGRDMVIDAAAEMPPGTLSRDTLLRLEHLLIAHQGRFDWGSPKLPMTPEALIVHYADDLDAKYNMMYTILRDDTTPGPVTSKKNLLMQPLFRGLPD